MRIPLKHPMIFQKAFLAIREDGALKGAVFYFLLPEPILKAFNPTQWNKMLAVEPCSISQKNWGTLELWYSMLMHLKKVPT